MSRGKVAILVACVCLVPATPASCPVRGPLWQHTWARQVARGLSHAHVNPLMRAWAAPPTCMSRGLRAYQGVYARTQGLTCERAMWLSGCYHPGQAPDNVREQPIPPGTAQNAGYFATSSPFSAFITEVVRVLGATSPRTAAALPPSGGNCIIRAATRRRRAVRAPLMLQNPHRHQPDVRRITYKSWAQDRLARNNSPNTAPPVAFPRKSSPGKRKNADFGVL